MSVRYNGIKYDVEDDSLYLNKKKIKNINEIEGLENLKQLKKLFLRENQIKDIVGLKTLTSLEELYLDFNSITEVIGIEYLKKLRVLSLHNNKINSIKNLENLHNLEELYLGQNRIKTIEGLESLNNLKKLYLFQNKIRNIEGLNSLLSLRALYLDFNRISELENIDELENLEELSLSRNRITEIKGLDSLNNLKILNLSYNCINEITGIENLRKLEELYLYVNKIKEIKSLDNLDNLQILHLYINKLEVIKGLDNLRELHTLYLFKNQINEIEGLENCINLNYLNLSSNQITEIKGLNRLRSLEYLILAGNKLEIIEGLEDLLKLRYLYLTENDIVEMKNLDNLNNLEILYLNDNKLKEIKGLENLVKLNEAHLDNNPFTESKEIFLSKKTITANEFRNYIKIKQIQEIEPYLSFEDPVYERNITKFKLDLNKVEDISLFLDIGTYRESKKIKASQNVIFFEEKPERVRLNSKRDYDKLIIYLIQMHSLKGVKQKWENKLKHFFFFIRHFWDSNEIDLNNVLIYNYLEQNACKKIQEFLNISLEKYSKEQKREIPNLIIFPENSIPYKLLDYLKNLSEKYKLLIIGGLEHKKYNGNFENRAVIIDEGMIEFQKKQTPVLIYDKIKKEYIQENIECKKFPEIKIFETSIGTLSIFICKDFLRLNEIIPYWARKNKVDFIVVPSFSNKILPFHIKILNLFDNPDGKDLKLLFTSMGEYGGSELFSKNDISTIEENFRTNKRDNVGELIVVRQYITDKKRKIDLIEKRKCFICGRTDNLHIDHIIPLSRGGTENLDNIRFVCPSCNITITSPK